MTNFHSNEKIPSLMVYQCGLIIFTMVKQPVLTKGIQEYDYIISVNWRPYQSGIFETSDLALSFEEIVLELINQHNTGELLTPYLKKDYFNRYVIEKLS